MKTYNLYCDESCHLANDHKHFMILSYISVPFNHMDFFKKNLVELKEKYNVISEIKWSTIFPPKEKFYLELVDLFFQSDLKFRALIVDKKGINETYYGKDFDDFYYKMYWQLLYHKMDTRFSYNIYLDIKDTLSATKVKKLKEILQVDYSQIRTVQNIRSHESIFMQVTDFLMGAINYKLNVPDDSKNGKLASVKNKVISRIEKNCGSLSKGTQKFEEKFNRFFIELK